MKTELCIILLNFCAVRSDLVKMFKIINSN